MEQKKYELTEETKEWFGRTLHRIRALTDFCNVHKGDLGGWIEKEDNLSQDDNAWVSGNARVCDNACVRGNALVSGNARVCDNALVSGNAWVFDNARVCGDACVRGNARVDGNAWVRGNAWVSDTRHLFMQFNIGSRKDTTTFFRTENNDILVSCGCFKGTINEFADAVKKTYGDNRHASDYAAAIEMAKIWIVLDGEESGNDE